MATAAKKLKKVQESNVSHLPTPPATTVRLGKQTFTAPASLGELVLHGAALKNEIDGLKDKLEEVNAKILAEVPRWMDGNGTLHIVIAGVDCTVSLRDSVAIADVGTLRELLGDRFPDLVKEKATYSPEPKLVSLALDGDDPMQFAVANCLRIQEAKATVGYKAA